MKKRLLFIASCFMLAAALCAPCSTFAAEPIHFAGAGTEEDPYQISSAQDLRFLAGRVNAGDETYNAAHYFLTADINLSEEEYAGLSTWEGYTPIGGNEETPFRGELDGGFHIVYNMQIDSDVDARYCGLIGVLDGGTVKNLMVDGVIQGKKTAGGIVGWNKGGTVINCISTCGMGTGGGLVGKNSDGGLLANCCVTNDYNPQKMLLAGVNYNGIVMDNTEGGIIENCYTLEYRSGGVVSSNEYRKHCYQFEYEQLGMPKTRRYNASFDSTGTLIPVDSYFDQDEAPDPIINGETTLLGALNAWVDAQGNKEYRQWVQHTGRYPSFGENLIICDYQVGDYIPHGETAPFVEVGMPEGRGLMPYCFESFPVMEGVSRTIWFREFEDYHIYDVLVDGKSAGLVSSYTFSGDGRDHTVTVRYVKAGSPDNFTLDAPYNGYPDVDETAWYGAEQEGVVRAATQLGLFKGDETGKFNPNASLSLAEAVKLASVIRDTYRGEEYPFDQTQGEHWYDTYVTYALENGILEQGKFEDYQRPATRGELAYIFYGNGQAIVEYESISDRTPPDMAEDHPYYIETVLLYQGGILRGSDEMGTFHPNETITRAEVAAIAVRAALPDRRIQSKEGDLYTTGQVEAKVIRDFTTYDAAVEQIRSGMGYSNEKAFETDTCTIFCYDLGGFMNAPLDSLQVVYKAGGAYPEGTILNLPFTTDRGWYVNTNTDSMNLSDDGKTFTYTYVFDEIGDYGNPVQAGGTYTYVFDIPTGTITLTQPVLRTVTYAQALAQVTTEEGYTVEKIVEAPGVTAVLRYRLVSERNNNKNYQICLVYKANGLKEEGTVDIEYPPATAADGSYADRAPDAMFFSKDGRYFLCTYYYIPYGESPHTFSIDLEQSYYNSGRAPIVIERLSAGTTIEKQVAGPVATALLVYDEHDGVSDYALYIIHTKTGAAWPALLPSTYAGTAASGGIYAPTDRAPDEISFSDDGQILTYVYRFDSALEGYHDAGTYIYKINVTTGEFSVAHSAE